MPIFRWGMQAIVTSNITARICRHAYYYMYKPPIRAHVCPHSHYAPSHTSQGLPANANSAVKTFCKLHTNIINTDTKASLQHTSHRNCHAASPQQCE